MKIIALYNKGNCGKTTVLKLLCGLLDADPCYEKKDFDDDGKDIIAVFEKDGKKIAVISGGDSWDKLKDAFAYIDVHKCDIVVCACRLRRSSCGSVNFIESLEKEGKVSEVIWYKKAYVEQSNAKYVCTNEIAEINQIQAKILFNEIISQ